MAGERGERSWREINKNWIRMGKGLEGEFGEEFFMKDAICVCVLLA